MNRWILPIDPAFLQTLGAWAMTGLLLGWMGLAAARWLALRPWIPAPWLPVAAGGAVALFAYGAFWAYFASPALGKMYSVVVLGAAILAERKGTRLTVASKTEWLATIKLQAAIGLFYLALLHLFVAHMNLYQLMSNRPLPGMPMDNQLPHEVATRLYHGISLKPFLGDWLSSDRPPLQSGWLLLFWPITAAAGFNENVASGTAAIWFQLLWIPAAYAFLRSLALPVSRAVAWTFALSLSGFFLMHTTYTWPKLAAGALVCGAFGLWVLAPASPDDARGGAAGGILAGLACLAHGGAIFSLVPIVPWGVWRCWRGERRKWLGAAATFLVLLSPWIAYQHFYDPPGNRLIKWHLAGQVSVDPRGVIQTLRDSYRARGWKQTVNAWGSNLHNQLIGYLGQLGQFTAAGARERRYEEFFYTVRALTWWPAGIALFAVALFRPSARSLLAAHGHAYLAVAAWTVLTILLWCMLIFTPGQAIVHQGSLGAMIAIFALLSALMELAGSWSLYGLVALQLTSLVTTWIGPNSAVNRPLDGVAVAIALAALGAFLQVSRRQAQ